MRNTLLILLLLTGCAANTRLVTPQEVSNIPDDCLNRMALTSWLDQQAKSPKPKTMTEDEYNAYVSTIKNKLWRLRSICQSG